MFADTHCHIDFEVFDKDRIKILDNCYKKNIRRIIVPSVRALDWEKNISLCLSLNSQFSNVNSQFLTLGLGLHPYFLTEHSEKDLSLLEEYCKKGLINAIGEIGLDYFPVKQELKNLDKKKQCFYFEKQLALAKKYSLPVLIHARKSHQDIIQLLKKYSPINGIIHAFNGSEVQAKQYLTLGFKLGFGGAFTNPRAKKLRHLVSQLPLEAMLLETDAPDMLPFFEVKKARKNAADEYNSPENIIGIFKEFASLREENPALIEKQLEKNRLKIFPDIH